MYTDWPSGAKKGNPGLGYSRNRFPRGESALSASSQVLPRAYTWTFPGSPIQIRVQLAVVDELQRGLAQPRGSREGGLLIGITPRSGSTEITGFQAASTLDAESIEALIANASGKVVGYYRIDRSGSLTLDEEDLYLAKAYFHDPSSVLLRIQANGSEPASACFFFWDNEQIHGDLPFMEVPLDRDQLAIAEQQRQLSQPTRVESLPALPPFRQATPRRRSAMWLGLGLGIVAVAAAGASAVYLYSNPHALPRKAPVAPVPVTYAPATAIPAVPKSELAFTVERSGADLLLSWNRESSIVSHATFGMLLIRAQNASRDIALTPEQLRLGSILYAPTADQVEIQLNVVAGERLARDSLIVLLPQKGEKSPVVTTAQSVDAARETVTGSKDGGPENTPPQSRAETGLPTSEPGHSLHLRGRGSVVALTRDAAAAFELQQHPDSLAKLVRDGSLFSVPSGTVITIQEKKNGVIKVLIMEGAMAGREGWAPAEQALAK